MKNLQTFTQIKTFLNFFEGVKEMDLISEDQVSQILNMMHPIQIQLNMITLQ